MPELVVGGLCNWSTHTYVPHLHMMRGLFLASSWCRLGHRGPMTLNLRILLDDIATLVLLFILIRYVGPRLYYIGVYPFLTGGIQLSDSRYWHRRLASAIVYLLMILSTTYYYCTPVFFFFQWKKRKNQAAKRTRRPTECCMIGAHAALLKKELRRKS